MGSLSEHFDVYEFKCPCCSSVGKNGISKLLINRLEKLHKELNCTAIEITSGYRCSNYSVSVGGYKNDAHTTGIASDIICYAPDNADETLTVNYNGKKVYKSDVVAEKAEIIGFGGIGIISDTAIHVDTRDSETYVNNHWFGDERNGNDNILTFYKGLTKNINSRRTKVIELIIDGETIFKSEVSEWKFLIVQTLQV